MLQLVRGSSFWGCLLSGILVPHGLATVKAREMHEYKWVCKTFWQRKHNKIVVELCITVMTLVSRPTSRLKSFEGVGIYRKLSHFVLSCNRVICISWCVSNVLQKIINGKSLLMTKSARPPLLLTTAHQCIFPDSATYTPKNFCSSPPADIFLLYLVYIILSCYTWYNPASKIVVAWLNRVANVFRRTVYNTIRRLR